MNYKQKHMCRIVGNAILSAVMAGSMITIPVYADEDTSPTEKTETVYAVLNPDGSVSNTVVSSWIHDDDGISNIKETLNLTDVENVKTDEEPKVSGNEYTWNVKGNDVYYKGNSKAQLPVSVKITYKLDGKEIKPDDLAGKSGHLTMTVDFTNNITKEVNIGGKIVDIHPSYLAGGMLTLNDDHYQNVSCKQGKIINDGNNEILTFAAIPGLESTLESAGLSQVMDYLDVADTVVIEADVKDYQTDSIMIGMTNDFNINELTSLNSISDLTSGISALTSASAQLEDGSRQLSEGTATLKEKSAPLTSAYPKIHQLADSTEQLNDGVTKLNNGVIQYTNGTEQVNTAMQQLLYGIPSGIDQVKQGIETRQPNTPASLKDGAEQLSQGLNALNTQVSELSGKISPEQIEKIQKTISSANDGLSDMQDTITKDQGILSQLSTALEGTTETLENLQSAAKALGEAEKHINEAIAEDNAIVEKDNAKIDFYNETVTSNNETTASNKAKLDTAAQTLNDDMNSAAAQANTDIQNAISALEAAKASATDESTQAQIQAQIDALSGIVVTAPSVTADTTGIQDQTQLEKLDTLKTIDTTEMLTIFGQVNTEISGLAGTLEQAGTAMESLSQDVEDAQKALDQMSTLVQGMQSELPADLPAKLKALTAALEQAAKASESISQGIETVDAALGQVESGSKNALEQVYTGTSTLVSQNAQLTNGMETLNASTEQLASQKDTFHQMADGLQSLEDALTKLNEGANTLYEGQSKFNQEGIMKLASAVNLGVGEVDALKAIINNIQILNDENRSFAGAPDGANTKVRFVYRTEGQE